MMREAGNPDNREVKADYSGFDVMGPSYPEPDYMQGKPFIIRKVTKDVEGQVVSSGGIIVDKTPGLRLYDTRTDTFTLHHPEDVFKYAEYFTCSYTWKQDPLEQDLQVKEMIRRLVELYKGVKWVWVDAWRIIQDSEEDKAINIQLMGKIYRYSSGNFIMLLDSKVDDEVGSWLRQLGTWTKYILCKMQAGITDKSRFFSRAIEETGHTLVYGYLDTRSWPWDEIRNRSWNEDQFEKLIKAILVVTSHRWATRMWTLQEVSLGPNSVVVGSNWACEYEAFEYGVGILDWYYLNAEQPLDYSINIKLLLVELINESKRWRRLYHLMPDLQVGDIIHRSHGRTCGLEEDRIYAIKGLLPYGDQIEVKYGRPGGAALAAQELARVCCRNEDYTWAAGLNYDLFPGNMGAIAIPGIGLMPRGIGTWKGASEMMTTVISDFGVARSGQMCKLEAESYIVNIFTIRLYNKLSRTFREPAWKQTCAVTAAALLAGFWAGGLIGGFFQARPRDGMSGQRHWSLGDIDLHVGTQDGINFCAAYMAAVYREIPFWEPEDLGCVVGEIDRVLSNILPYGCREASLARVRRYGECSSREMMQLSNLLYWPHVWDLTNVFALANGEIGGRETFALIRPDEHGIFHRIASAMAFEEGKLSEHWGERQVIVEGANGVRASNTIFP